MKTVNLTSLLCALMALCAVACSDDGNNEVQTAGTTQPPSGGRMPTAGQSTMPGGQTSPAAGNPTAGAPMAGNHAGGSPMAYAGSPQTGGQTGSGGSMTSGGVSAGAPSGGMPASAGHVAGGAAMGGDITGGVVAGTPGAGGQALGGQPMGGQAVGGQAVGGNPAGGQMAGGTGGMAPLGGQPVVQRRVDYCRYQGPTGENVNPAQGFDVYGLVYVQGISDRSDATDVDAELWAEAGYGPRGTNPEGNVDWTWQGARPNPEWNAAQRMEPNNDEYMATLSIPLLGEYDLAYRFTLDGGANWLYCDRGVGSSDGYSAEQAGQVSVVAVELGDYCRIQHPLVHTGQPGDILDVYGIIYEQGLTDQSPLVNDAMNVVVEAGFGPRQTEPDNNVAWQWTRAAGNPGWMGQGDDVNNDEYVAQLLLPSIGDYDLAFRFSIDEGQNWLYCDTGNGSADGYSTADAAQLTTACPPGQTDTCGSCLPEDAMCP